MGVFRFEFLRNVGVNYYFRVVCTRQRLITSTVLFVNEMHWTLIFCSRLLTDMIDVQPFFLGFGLKSSTSKQTIIYAISLATLPLWYIACCYLRLFPYLIFCKFSTFWRRTRDKWQVPIRNLQQSTEGALVRWYPPLPHYVHTLRTHAPFLILFLIFMLVFTMVLCLIILQHAIIFRFKRTSTRMIAFTSCGKRGGMERSLALQHSLQVHWWWGTSVLSGRQRLKPYKMRDHNTIGSNPYHTVSGRTVNA